MQEANMAQRYVQIEQWWMAIQNALKPRLLLTMSLSILGAVVLFGLFCIGGKYDDFAGILTYFVGVVASLLWFLFGLTALAHQLHQDMLSEPIPNSIEAFRFAWGRTQALLMLPAWGAGLLLVLLLGEMLVLSLANIPGLGLIWLTFLLIPLLLLNTVVAVALILALFNIATRVALTQDNVERLKSDLWDLVKQRLPMLLIYNLGGVLVTVIAAVVILSPLWLGAQITLNLMDYTAHEALNRIIDSVGFWGSIAHLLGLIMLGLLLAAIVSVPGVVITHMTLLVQHELMLESAENSQTSPATEHTPNDHEEPKNDSQDEAETPAPAS